MLLSFDLMDVNDSINGGQEHIYSFYGSFQ